MSIQYVQKKNAGTAAVPTPILDDATGRKIIQDRSTAAGISYDIATGELKYNDNGVIRTILSNKAPSEILITTRTVLAAESGRTFYLDLAAGFVVTLPAVALGLYYEFIVKTAPTPTSYTIVCPGAAALFKGHVLTTDVNSGTDPDFDTTAVATLTIVTAKAVAGDRIRVDCDGINWFYSAETSLFDAITGT